MVRIEGAHDNCYAMGVAARFSGKGQPYEGLAMHTIMGPMWTNKVALIEDRVEEPLHWWKPRRIFVNSMSDLFHEQVPDEFIDRVFAVMVLTPRHTFQVLTKRPERMARYFGRGRSAAVWAEARRVFLRPQSTDYGYLCGLLDNKPWSLPNVWLDVSVEDQRAADERIPLLLQAPGAVHWLSCEPLPGPVDLRRALWLCDQDECYLCGEISEAGQSKPYTVD